MNKLLLDNYPFYITASATALILYLVKAPAYWIISVAIICGQLSNIEERLREIRNKLL
jgi:hypothetical protein